MKSKDFLGRGFKFPLNVSMQGSVELSEFDQNIEESIRIIIGTYPGERVMREHFGCFIHDLVFAPNNSATAALASYYVSDALTKWEPRIEKIEVNAIPDSDRENVMMIDIKYTVRATNQSSNLVYPFYLKEE
jgi:phage baseplate assembly protein W